VQFANDFFKLTRVFEVQVQNLELIRVDGRLSQSSETYYTSHPFLLPNNHEVVKALFVHIHRSKMHKEARTVCGFARQRYLVINA